MTDHDELEAGRAELKKAVSSNGGQSTSPRRRIQILTDVQLATLPEQPPLIEGLFARGALVSLVGVRGSYKSFIALDWSLCIATGTPWLGRAVHRGASLYVCA